MFRKHRGQGLLMIYLVLMVSISFSLYLFKGETYSSTFFQIIGTSDLNSAAAGTAGFGGDLKDRFLTSMGVGAITGTVSAYAIGFPNYVGMFLGVGIGLLGSLFMPVALFNANSGLPIALRAFLVVVNNLILTLGVMGWLKGNSP